MEPILALITVALLANLALIVVSAARFGDARARSGIPGARSAEPAALDPAAQPPPLDGPDPDIRPAALDRVILVGTWVFLFATTTIVAVTGLWAERQGPILLVLAGAAIATLVLHQRPLERIPDSWLRTIEGATGLLFAGLLVALTGGAFSPFFFALPLIVVGAAILVRPRVTLGLTAGAGLVYLVAVVAASTTSATGMSQLAVATAGVNLMALCLVAYVGMAIGREQRRAREDANRRATIDPLTGLRTRPYLFAALERELARSERTGRSFCLLMIDLDELKLMNDRHGHLLGDRALRVVGDVIRAGTRRIDTGARFGGDEFVVLLPETDSTGGWVLAEKIRQGVAAAGLDDAGVPVRTSVSVGLATYPQDGETVGVLLEHADAEMYGAKRASRARPGVGVMDVPATPAGDRGRPV